MRVTVEDGRIVDVEPLHLDVARWAHESIDVSACADETQALLLIGDALARAAAAAAGRPLAVRITLTGESPAHARLVAHREALEAEARALGFQVASDCWVERVKIATRAPPRVAAPTEADALDIEGLLAGAADDPEFAPVVAEIMASVADKLPRDLRAALAADPAAIAERAALARDFLRGERS